MSKQDAEKRFWKSVEKNKKCWLWKSALSAGGYGVFGIDNKIIYVHRFSYELHKGKIPKDKQIDHLCRNRSCVNPDHLELVTQKENTARGEGISAKYSKRTRCKNGHRLSGDNLIQYSCRGGRICKICKRKFGIKSSRKYYKKIKQQKASKITGDATRVAKMILEQKEE